RKAVPLHPNHQKIRYATITTYCNYWWGCRRILCGEVLDIDTITGGFNLQAAWTTGYVVGQHIGE
ncbi:NAD(P)/FAD-dependent oxidoreductase, partial [Segatella sp.]|uniref:NAD(P)/FAD-dependent oxidoreductase n=1 Tax=Segatella sp. TaxID=2974253 RepID=UPI003079B313